jgi:hypothetical protein
MHRILRFGSRTAAMAGLVCVLCACSSSPSSPSAQAATACQRVGALLSNGPDPGVDPVGYAEAQVDPLRNLRTSDQSIQLAVGHLASAYETFFEDNGTAAAKQRVVSAASSVNAVCPGIGAGI